MSFLNASTEDWFKYVDQWKNYTKDVPKIVREDILKSARSFQKEDALRGPKTSFVDPLSVQYALGYKDRRHSLTYDVLKKIPQQLSIVAAIIMTRCNQVAAFSQPYRMTKSLGYMIKHKDPSHETTTSEMEFIKSLEDFIAACGKKGPNPYYNGKRDDFEAYLKKLVRDSLTFDQCATEIVPDRRGRPYEFYCVDGATMRLATRPEEFGADSQWKAKDSLVHSSGHPYHYGNMVNYNVDPEEIRYIQLVNGQIKNAYSEDELIFGVRNPRADIYIQGYGYGELEQLITIITGMLNAEEYNRRFFVTGSAPKGLLNLKGDNMAGEMLENFQRQWRENIEGVQSSWRTPIINAEQGIEWIPLTQSNQEMEFGNWLEYQLKVACAVFQIDPAEVNFDLKGGVQQTPLFESSQEWKLKASRDKGLKPLLRFIAKMMNQIIDRIDDHFYFDFVGLDELTEQEKHEMRKEAVGGAYQTLNEVRRAEDLPDVEGGDIVLNPTLLQALQLKQTMDMQKKAQEQASQAQTQQPQQQGGGGQQPQQGQGQPQQPQVSPSQAHQQSLPQYGDHFGKSIQGKFLEIDISDWIQSKRDMS